MSSRNWSSGLRAATCIVLAALLPRRRQARAQGTTAMALGGTGIAGLFDVAGPQEARLVRASVPHVRQGPHSAPREPRRSGTNGYKDHPSHVKPDGSMNFAGDEILTFTIDGVGSFTMAGHFLCVGGATLACGSSEEGEGGGREQAPFAGMTGTISIHGSAVFFGSLPTDEDPWLWVAQMTGSVCTAHQASAIHRRASPGSATPAPQATLGGKDLILA